MPYNKFTVGLTGGIGSGKTTVTDIFATFAVPIIDTDVIAKNITLKTGIAFPRIVAHFGQAILNAHGEIDRAVLRQKIFSQPEHKSWLEKLLHPLIHAQMVSQINLSTAPYCIAVIPLLIETAQTKDFDHILVIDAPPALQLSRAQLRDHSNLQTIEAMMATQVSREIRCNAADDIIVNDQGLATLTTAVKKLHKKYLGLAKLKGHTLP